MARYLIAGAAGYVGSRLAEYLLAQGHSVRGLVRDPEREVVQRLAGQGMAVWEGDLINPDTLVGVANGVEHVYNLTSRSVLHNGSVRQLYVDGNCNLIAACSRARSVRSYSFTGNAAPYGDRGDEWLTEDSDVAPNFPLGQVMVDAEQAILDVARTHHFPAIILRVGTIYGPERDLVDAVENGTATLIGDGENFVARIHVDDLVSALERVALDGQPGAVYNVSDDMPVRVGELFDVIGERLRIEPPRGYSRESALASGLDSSVVGMVASSMRLSNRRLSEELGVKLHYSSIYHWLDERLESVERTATAAD